MTRQRYPGYVTVEEIANVARLETAILPEISALVGQKYKLLVSISNKWKSTNSEDLSFQVSRIEETYKPELPPLVFGASSGSGGASASASGSAIQLPLLGPTVMPCAGHGSPAGQLPASPAAKYSRATPAGGSSAPRHGVRHSLFMTPSRDKKQPSKDKELPAVEDTLAVEEVPDVIQPSIEPAVDDATTAVEDKDDEPMPPKTKRANAAAKSGGTGKKPRH